MRRRGEAGIISNEGGYVGSGLGTAVSRGKARVAVGRVDEAADCGVDGSDHVVLSGKAYKRNLKQLADLQTSWHPRT